MTPIRTIIVDDQPMARERLAALLTREPDIVLVAQCSDGRQAVEAIRRLDPELVFLDLQMPEMDGFDVIVAIGAERMPAAIFVTAYDEYALRAFEVHALDYLLKPFGRERFQRALQRARLHLQRERDSAIGRRLVSFIGELRPDLSEGRRLLVRSDGRIAFVDYGGIDWVEAEGNYVRLHVGPESHLVRWTMAETEARLRPFGLVRIHRSRLVNLERVKAVQADKDVEYSVILDDDTRLGVGRAFRAALEERLERGS